jgi:hypothetical protein
VDDFKERLKALDDRVDEIMASDRPNRVKLIRVRHVRHQMEEMIAEINAITGKEIKKICQQSST